MASPLVSVVMSVLDGARFLAQAVDSILAQTFHDLEFVIVDDGSTDATPKILAELQRRDARIQLYRQEHQGLIGSLNRGCHLARGKYVARMDADDVSHPDRIVHQVQFMQSHPNCLLLGTAAELIDFAGKRVGSLTPPGDSETITRKLQHGNVFVHGSILMLRAALDQAGFYDESACLAEDYDLWCRLARLGQVVNLTELLYSLRVHSASVSVGRIDAQLEAMYRIRSKHYGTPPPSWAERRTACADAHLRYAQIFAASAQYRAARVHLQAAWTAKPWSPTVLRALITHL